jgi:pyruvate/2-oxoglutarate/acetoin dehydrogenase E1 component
VNTARPRNNLVYLLIIVAIGAIIFTALRSNSTQSQDVPLSEVAALINAGKAKEVVVSGDDVTVDTGSEVVTSRKDSSTDLSGQLIDLGLILRSSRPLSTSSIGRRSGAHCSAR